MKKLINIKGRLDEKGSLANTLNVMSAKEGKNLTDYISSILENHVKKHNK